MCVEIQGVLDAFIHPIADLAPFLLRIILSVQWVHAEGSVIGRRSLSKYAFMEQAVTLSLLACACTLTETPITRHQAIEDPADTISDSKRPPRSVTLFLLPAFA